MANSTTPSPSLRRVVRPLREFLQTEAGGGVLLLIATVAALVWANSPWSSSYGDFWHTKLRVGGSGWGVEEDLQHWVNDLLMAVFFFLIGLEVKREAAAGELRSVRAALLPALGAAGGMAGLRIEVVHLPRGVRPGHVVGAGALGGIGFTAALFITSLAFESAALQADAKIGILAGSVVAGVVSAAILASRADRGTDDVDLTDEVPFAVER